MMLEFFLQLISPGSHLSGSFDLFYLLLFNLIYGLLLNYCPTKITIFIFSYLEVMLSRKCMQFSERENFWYDFIINKLSFSDITPFFIHFLCRFTSGWHLCIVVNMPNCAKNTLNWPKATLTKDPPKLARLMFKHKKSISYYPCDYAAFQ